MKRYSTVAASARLFVSYAHQNSAWFARLSPLLKFHEQPRLAYVWHDHELKAGDRWDKEIRKELELMNVFVCLVSYEFLASDYIRTVELPKALKRNKKGEVEIVPIVLFDVDIAREHKALSAFNPLPAYGKCWSEYEKNNGHYQDAHKPIREGLRQVIEKVSRR